MNILVDARKAVIAAVAAASAVEASGLVVGKIGEYLHLGILAVGAALVSGGVTYVVGNGSSSPVHSSDLSMYKTYVDLTNESSNVSS